MDQAEKTIQPSRRKSFWRWPVGGLAAGALVGLVAALTYQETYTSRAVARVVPSLIPERFFPAGAALDVIEIGRRETMHRAYTRQTLKTAVESHDLYRSERTRMSMEEVVELMARQIRIDVKQVMTVTFSYPDPVLAQRVARHLLTALMDDSGGARGVQAKIIVDFLRAESEKAAQSWQDLIAKAPKVSGPAAERLALDRDLAASRYRTLRERLAEAETLVTLDERKQGPIVEVVELASLPEQPDFNKWILLAAGAGGGLLLGLLAGLAGRLRRL